MDYVEACDEPATETPSRPVRPSKRLLSEDGSSGTNSPTYTKSETFPDEPHGGVHPMIWWMLRTIQKDVAKFNGVEGRVAVIEDQLDYGAEIAKLKVTVEHLVESNKTLAGRLMRADATNCRQQTTITDLKMRSMRDDLIITTSGPAYKETREEQTESTVRKFLTDEMRIPNENNMCINSSHRMGQANGNFNRMLIARLPRRKDQTTIFDNANLLWLTIERPEQINSLLGVASPLKPRGVSDVMTEQGHAFQAWDIPAHSLADVRDGMDQFLQLTELAGATHVPYGFRFPGAQGMHEYFQSDGDLHSGLFIVSILRELSQ